MDIYRRHYHSERFTLAIQADFSQAACPLEYRLEAGCGKPLWPEDADWNGCPYQVADARHAVTAWHKDYPIFRRR
jgi:hypothetical protein